VDAAERAVAIGIHRDVVIMLPAVRAGAQMLASVLDPANGETLLHREPREADFLRQQDSLVPKSTTYVGRNDADTSLLYAETVQQAVAHDVRHLGTAVERELIE